MVIWFNVKEAREFLLKNGYVYTLRPKKRKRVGREVLMYGSFGKKGMVMVGFIKKITRNRELEEYVKCSGFRSVIEWRSVAGESRFLYRVDLLTRQNQCTIVTEDFESKNK